MASSPRAAIVGMGSAVPRKCLHNTDFEKFLDTSDEWIAQRTGIRQRHVVSEGETTATLGAEAAQRALDDAGLSIDDIDLIICATISPEMIFPATACFIQQALGATDVPAFDISAACSGYVYALATGARFIEAGAYRRVLIIGAESLSRFSDYTDRGSCILFGDAAGASVLAACDEADRGVRYTVLAANGAGWDYIHVPGGGSREPATPETVASGRHFIKLRGREVYKFAVEKMQWLISDCMEKCSLGIDDVDMVVPHQVNIRIIESAAEKLGLPMSKVYVNIDRYGNTSAASIPLAMHHAWQEKRIQAGSTVVMAAFGAGLTWAGAVVRL